MSIPFPKLPYAVDALEPHLSARTLEFHHGKHHKGYVDKLNAAIADSPYAGKALEDIVLAAHEAADTAIFNNAAQAWNHSFLWHSMTPHGRNQPNGTLAAAIDSSFGDLQGFRDAFKNAALAQFGSGWTWLVSAAGELEIVCTGNAFTPLIDNVTPLLTLDVWEHAYYLDYQNQRNAYIDAFIGKLINWEFAEQNYQAARAAA